LTLENLLNVTNPEALIEALPEPTQTNLPLGTQVGIKKSA
jgi:hypothetical protein